MTNEWSSVCLVTLKTSGAMIPEVKTEESQTTLGIKKPNQSSNSEGELENGDEERASPFDAAYHLASKGTLSTHGNSL